MIAKLYRFGAHQSSVPSVPYLKAILLMRGDFSARRDAANGYRLALSLLVVGDQRSPLFYGVRPLAYGLIL